MISRFEHKVLVREAQRFEVNRRAAPTRAKLKPRTRRVRLNEWNGLPLLERHRVCQIGSGFKSNR